MTGHPGPGRGLRLWFLSMSLGILLGLLASCGGSGNSATVLLPGPAPGTQPATPTGISSFFIQLRFPDDSLTAAQQFTLQQAADRWMQIITGDVADASLVLPDNACLPGIAGLAQRIDDLLIDVTLAHLDGLGGVLARAGPCVVRQGSLLPVYGIVQFDREDVELLQQQNRLVQAALHEYGHVLGLGSLWQERGLIQGAGSADPRYRGVQGNVAFQVLLQAERSSPVPIENQGGPGSRDVHWREQVLDSELMTGSLDLGPTPLSLVTAGAVADLGYRIDPNQVDEYQLPASASDQSQLQVPTATPWPLVEMPLPHPVRIITPQGEQVGPR